jgi:hypothetical protein
MINNNCNHQVQNCGCSSTSYTVVPPCPPACPEVFNAQCIVYTGTDILCNQDIVISRYDYLDTIISKLVNYVCQNSSSRKVILVVNMTTSNPVSVTHNLGSDSVLVQVIDVTTNALLHPDDYTVNNYTSNSVNVTRTDAGGSTRIVVIG